MTFLSEFSGDIHFPSADNLLLHLFRPRLLHARSSAADCFGEEKKEDNCRGAVGRVHH